MEKGEIRERRGPHKNQTSNMCGAKDLTVEKDAKSGDHGTINITVEEVYAGRYISWA